jgi:hypothetical protein
MAYAVRKGKIKRSDANEEVLKIADGDMTDQEIKDFMKLKESQFISLQTYINERLNPKHLGDAKKKSKYKEFEDVEIGDRGEDYNGEKGTVIEVGTAIELIPMDKYGSLQMCLDDGLIEDKDDCVIVKIHGEEIGYVYGPEGFVCYK